MSKGPSASSTVNALLGRQLRRYSTTDFTPGTSNNGVVVVAPYEPQNVVQPYAAPLYLMYLQVFISPAAAGNHFVQIFDTSMPALAQDPLNFNPVKRSIALAGGATFEWTPPKVGTEFDPDPPGGIGCAPSPWGPAPRRSGVDYGYPFGEGLCIALSNNVDLVDPSGATGLMWIEAFFRPWVQETEPRAELRGNS